CCPGPAGVRGLAESPAASGLRELQVPCNEIGDEGAEALGRSSHLSNLAVLGLYKNGVGPRGLAALVSGNLSGLAALHVPSNRMGPEAGRVLAGATVSGLQWLLLDDTDLGDEGVCGLASSAALASLTHLDLRGNGLTVVAARALAESPYLRNLTW